VNLFALLDQAAARFGDRGAVFHGDRQVCTWGELRERALRLATSIRQSAPAGARIAIASENRPEIVELMFATWAAECVVVPINFKLHVREMVQILDDAGAALVFASAKIGPELVSATEVPVEIITGSGYESRFAAALSEPPTTDQAALAWLFYTSGTTGRSKGAMLSHRNEAPMTITGLRRADHPGADDAILGSVGYARSGVEVAVLRSDGTPAPVGEIGEIACRGDVVMSGYWNNPEATAETLKDGWLHTGDMGSFDAHGYLTLRDRSKDVVISGGSNIYPREVEEVLLAHPSIIEPASSVHPTPTGARSWSRSSSETWNLPTSTRSCWTGSAGSSGPSATSSSTSYRRTATARY
jgi:acyl-CoA synthetase (AMP-forming)/AMP-acid ligase II